MTTTKTALRVALIAGVSFISMAGAASAQTASPADAEARIAALEAQLSALSSQIADLKAATAASLKDVRATQSATTVSIAGGKPTIASGDGAFSATFHGVKLNACNPQTKTTCHADTDVAFLASDSRGELFDLAREIRIMRCSSFHFNFVLWSPTCMRS